MLFDTSPEIFESEKERNLYYKIFAGYLFNDLIPGYDNRLHAFCNLLNSTEERGKKCSTSAVQLNPTSTHISFDNHLYLYSDLDTDRGEFADILLQDKSNHTLVTIEAKLHSNWSYEKDIISNQKRLDKINDSLGDISIFPILLVSKFRWNHTKNKESAFNSNYAQFRDELDCRFRVILWEQIADIISNEPVKQYLHSQVSRFDYGFGYQFQNGWFVQNPNLKKKPSRLNSRTR